MLNVRVILKTLPNRLLKEEVRNRLSGRGIDLTIVNKDLGYELRSADPIPFDLEYTQDLGYAAVKYLLEGGSGAIVANALRFTAHCPKAVRVHRALHSNDPIPPQHLRVGRCVLTAVCDPPSREARSSSR